ncbi:MAG: hypothetical protein QW416_07915 [Candidatus Nitrosocaldaceae archaeon]
MSIKTNVTFPELYGSSIAMTNPNLIYVLDRKTDTNNPYLDFVIGNAGNPSSNQVITAIPNRGDMIHVLKISHSLGIGFQQFNIDISGFNNNISNNINFKYYLYVYNRYVHSQSTAQNLSTFYNYSMLLPVTSWKGKPMAQGHLLQTWVNDALYYLMLARFLTVESYNKDISRLPVLIHNPTSTGSYFAHTYVVYSPFVIVPAAAYHGRKGIYYILKGYLSSLGQNLFLDYNNQILNIASAGYESTDKRLVIKYDSNTDIYTFNLILTESDFIRFSNCYGVFTRITINE